MSTDSDYYSSSGFHSTSLPTSPDSAVDDDGNASVSIAVYAVAIPILVWICAIGVCYPVIFCFYRFCLGVRFGKSLGRRGRSPACCCWRCYDIEAVDSTADNTSISSAARRARRRRSSTGSGPTPPDYSLPPAYDIALSMPKPQVGDSVRFQSNVDGGWCTFTWNDDVDNGPPPQYVAFRHSVTDDNDAPQYVAFRHSVTDDNDAPNNVDQNDSESSRPVTTESIEDIIITDHQR